MGNVSAIHPENTANRRHFIVEWADHRNLKRADIARKLSVDKGTVTKWFQGTIPSDQWIYRLAELLGTTRDGLFRHPDDDWLARFFRERSEEDRKKAIRVLETIFPTQKAS